MLQRALRPLSGLRKMLQGAEIMWIALRDVPMSGELDGVLAMTADLRELDPSRLASDGGGWADVGSGEPGGGVPTHGADGAFGAVVDGRARNQLMLLATPLEADGVLKVVRGAPAVPRRDIPVDAALAFSLSAVSMRGEFAQRYPGIARVLRGSTLVGTLDVSLGEVDEVILDVTVTSPNQERSLRLQKLFEALIAEMASSPNRAVVALGKSATLPCSSPTQLRLLCRAPGADLSALVEVFSEAPPVVHEPAAAPE
ncbi:MAG: hypothetical protein U0165_12945 [Polyangiaceae bacterium]